MLRRWSECDEADALHGRHYRSTTTTTTDIATAVKLFKNDDLEFYELVAQTLRNGTTAKDIRTLLQHNPELEPHPLENTFQEYIGRVRKHQTDSLRTFIALRADQILLRIVQHFQIPSPDNGFRLRQEFMPTINDGSIAAYFRRIADSELPILTPSNTADEALNDAIRHFENDRPKFYKLVAQKLTGGTTTKDLHTLFTHNPDLKPNLDYSTFESYIGKVNQHLINSERADEPLNDAITLFKNDKQKFYELVARTLTDGTTAEDIRTLLAKHSNLEPNLLERTFQDYIERVKRQI